MAGATSLHPWKDWKELWTFEKKLFFVLNILKLKEKGAGTNFYDVQIFCIMSHFFWTKCKIFSVMSEPLKLDRTILEIMKKHWESVNDSLKYRTVDYNLSTADPKKIQTVVKFSFSQMMLRVISKVIHNTHSIMVAYCNLRNFVDISPKFCYAWFQWSYPRKT